LALDQEGISCFTTPSAEEFLRIRQKALAHLATGGEESHLPHANQLWMLVGFEIFRHLRDRWECLEVFPQATVKLLGAAGLHKSKKGGVLAQLARASSYTGWPQAPTLTALEEVAHGSSHDRLDAYLAAWVASLSLESRLPLGSPPDDVIWVPRIAVGDAGPS
jgi:hypothetical protein